MKYYVIVSHGTEDCYVRTDDNCAALAFDTEAEAIEDAKSCAPAIVVRLMAEVTEVTKVKVTKVK